MTPKKVAWTLLILLGGIVAVVYTRYALQVDLFAGFTIGRIVLLSVAADFIGFGLLLFLACVYLYYGIRVRRQILRGGEG